MGFPATLRPRWRQGCALRWQPALWTWWRLVTWTAPPANTRASRIALFVWWWRKGRPRFTKASCPASRGSFPGTSFSGSPTSSSKSTRRSWTSEQSHIPLRRSTGVHRFTKYTYTYTLTHTQHLYTHVYTRDNRVLIKLQLHNLYFDRVA